MPVIPRADPPKEAVSWNRRPPVCSDKALALIWHDPQVCSYMPYVCISGSFRRHIDAIISVVQEFVELGACVLSPADPRVVGKSDEFLFVASDRVRSVRLVQDRHLQCIQASDFLWLVAPDGYVGTSATLEVGYAIAHSIPILAASLPADLTLRQYVSLVDGPRSAIDLAAKARSAREPKADRLLIDPHASVETVHRTLERIDRLFIAKPAEIDERAAQELDFLRQRIADVIAVPAVPRIVSGS